MEETPQAPEALPIRSDFAPCAAGSTERCFYEIASQHGPVISAAQWGDYVYWAESGTTDTLNNYNYDAAFVRAKLGTWEREEVLTDVDLRHGGRRTVDNFQLFAQGDYLFWSWGSDESDYLALEGGAHASVRGKLVSPERCAVVDQFQYCAESDIVWRRDLAAGGLFESWYEGKFSFVLPPAQDALYVGSYEQEGELTARIARIDIPSGTAMTITRIPVVVDGIFFYIERATTPKANPMPLPPISRAPLRDFVAERPIGVLEDGLLGAGQVRGNAFTWRAIASTKNYFGQSDGFVYWWHESAGSDGDVNIQLERVRPDGSDASSIAHFPHDVSSWRSVTEAPKRLSSIGAAIAVIEDPTRGQKAGFRFIPFPAH